MSAESLFATQQKAMTQIFALQSLADPDKALFLPPSPSPTETDPGASKNTLVIYLSEDCQSCFSELVSKVKELEAVLNGRASVVVVTHGRLWRIVRARVEKALGAKYQMIEIMDDPGARLGKFLGAQGEISIFGLDSNLKVLFKRNRFTDARALLLEFERGA